MVFQGVDRMTSFVAGVASSLAGMTSSVAGIASSVAGKTSSVAEMTSPVAGMTSSVMASAGMEAQGAEEAEQIESQHVQSRLSWFLKKEC